MTKTGKQRQPHAVERKNKNSRTVKINLAGSELEKPKNQTHQSSDPIKKEPFLADEYSKLEKNVDSYDEENDGF